MFKAILYTLIIGIFYLAVKSQAGLTVMHKFVEEGVTKLETVRPPWGGKCANIFNKFHQNQTITYTFGNRSNTKGMYFI